MQNLVNYTAAIVLALLWAGCSSEDPESTNVDETETQAPAPDESSPESADAPPVTPVDTSGFPEIVATVNGVEIEKSELLKRASGFASQAPPAEDTVSAAFYASMLEELVSAELLFQASRGQDLMVDDAAVEQQISTIRARFPDASQFEQALAQQGLTLDEFHSNMRRDMSIQSFIDAEIMPRVTVAEAAIQKFYNDNPESMRQPDQLRLSHILKRVEPGSTPEDKAAIRQSLEAVLEQARGGADFAALAREHSEDPGSATQGGELVVSRGETVPPFERAAFALELGGVSDVVETQFGFHIITVSEKIEGKPVPFADVRPRIEEFLRQQAVQQAIGNVVDSLRASGSIELFI